MNYPTRICVAVDQLANAFCAGNPDMTISGRCGYFSVHAKKGKGLMFWRLLEAIINWTFEPIDGPDHCLQAWRNDKGEEFGSGSDAARMAVGVIVILTCPFIAIFLRLAVIIIPVWKNQSVN